jgi:hygromycin-B 7''-O-kinase
MRCEHAGKPFDPGWPPLYGEPVPDTQLGVAEAQALLRSVLSGVRVTEVVNRTGGQLSTVYEVRCAAGAFIVKVYAPQWRWKLAKEVDVYQIMARHGVGPIPEIVHAEPDPGPFGFSFIVMTKLPGRPLSEVSSDLDDAQIGRVYSQMGAALSAIHRIGQDAFGYRVTEILDPEPDNTAYMTRQFSKKLREFGDLGGDPVLRDAIETYVARRTGLFASCTAPVLCHNDFYEGNVLVARAGGAWEVTGFVDVENALAADPLLDLAKTQYYSIKGDADKLAGLLDGYGPLPPDGPERLSLYRLYHALELWDWFAMIGSTAPLASIAGDLREMADAGP